MFLSGFTATICITKQTVIVFAMRNKKQDGMHQANYLQTVLTSHNFAIESIEIKGFEKSSTQQ